MTGKLAVDRVLYEGGTLNEIVVRFEQHCEGAGPALRGFFRYDADDPTQPTPPPPASSFTYQPPPGATPATGSYLYFQSTAGDYIGGGRTDLYTAPASIISVSESSGAVKVAINRNNFASWWYLDFSGPDAQTALQPGAYVDVERYPFHNPMAGGFDIYGEGRGCNTLKATFAVDQVTYVGDVLQSVAIRFVQRCEVSGPPLYGAFRWERPAA